MVSGLISKQV